MGRSTGKRTGAGPAGRAMALLLALAMLLPAFGAARPVDAETGKGAGTEAVDGGSPAVPNGRGRASVGIATKGTLPDLYVKKRLAAQGSTDDAAQAFSMVDGTYGFKLVDGEYVSNSKGKHGTTATSTWTAKYDMEGVSFKYSYSSESGCDKFTLVVAGNTVEDGASGTTTEKSWSGSLKAGDKIVMTYAKDGSVDKNDDQCKVYDVLVLNSADTEDDTEFTFLLTDPDGKLAPNKPYTVGGVEKSTDAGGGFKLKAGETACFGHIAEAGTVWTVSELPTSGYQQVVPPEYETVQVELSEGGDNTAEFWNREGAGEPSGCPPDGNVDRIGTPVAFKCSASIKSEYTVAVIMSDDMSDSLTFQPDSVKVRVYPDGGETGYDVSTDCYRLIEGGQDGNCTFELVIETRLLFDRYSFKDGYRIDATYRAILNEKALVKDPDDPCATRLVYWNSLPST